MAGDSGQRGRGSVQGTVCVEAGQSPAGREGQRLVAFWSHKGVGVPTAKRRGGAGRPLEAWFSRGASRTHRRPWAAEPGFRKLGDSDCSGRGRRTEAENQARAAALRIVPETSPTALPLVKIFQRMHPSLSRLLPKQGLQVSEQQWSLTLVSRAVPPTPAPKRVFPKGSAHVGDLTTAPHRHTGLLSPGWGSGDQHQG